MYNLKWILKQLISKITNKPLKGYKRTLTINEILRLGGVIK